MIRIGLYSEDQKLQLLLSSALGKEYQILFESSEDGINLMLAGGGCDVMIFDLDSSHTALKQRIAYAHLIAASQVPLVVMADDGLRPIAVDLVRLGAYSYCRKPPSVRDLKAVLRRAHESSTLKRKLQTVQQHLDEVSSCDRMIGSSPQMQQVYDLVRRVTDLTASVLITGESGTGKELIAGAIHNLGVRSGRPFVAVSCGAIPETLIEAELFGHEKGAFTGTVAAREGYLEQAGDGTLFLDEIGELSQSTQVKLLRVIQQREFSRLGSNRLIPLRARLIFATHADLAELVAQGRFRTDLYYRINVMRIDAPSLQQRPGDIEQISLHFLRQYSEMYQKQVVDIHTSAMTLLLGYSWPGNVRELENVIQRAIILASGESIRAEDLPLNIQEESIVSIGDYLPAGSFERQLRDFKIKLAATAVRENNGNKTLAARNLQISRAYLHRLIRLAEQDPAMGPSLLEPNSQEVGTA
ncbi:MAG TPA: sigma-54 dependent transcriptional regulator [Acidobacteriaceae bacterium]|jgi:DNA-binding NtrC family response regulator|nr:sigma-54 dependent transcriptional regulator [Acidobacteriaceae bacterium]